MTKLALKPSAEGKIVQARSVPIIAGFAGREIAAYKSGDDVKSMPGWVFVQHRRGNKDLLIAATDHFLPNGQDKFTYSEAIDLAREAEARVLNYETCIIMGRTEGGMREEGFKKIFRRDNDDRWDEFYRHQWLEGSFGNLSEPFAWAFNSYEVIAVPKRKDSKACLRFIKEVDRLTL